MPAATSTARLKCAMAKKSNNRVERCDWGTRGGELMAAYHDEEWGVPVHDDQKQFEFLTLESAQAGLSGSWCCENARRIGEPSLNSTRRKWPGLRRSESRSSSPTQGS